MAGSGRYRTGDKAGTHSGRDRGEPEPDAPQPRRCGVPASQRPARVPGQPGDHELFGRTAYPSLADVPEPVDIVDVFRRPEYVTPIAEQAVAAGAGTLWLQLGVINAVAAEIAEAGGLDVVMDKCLRVEHARVLGG